MFVFADVVNSDKAMGRFRRYKIIFTPQRVSCFYHSKVFVFLYLVVHMEWIIV